MASCIIDKYHTTSFRLTLHEEDETAHVEKDYTNIINILGNNLHILSTKTILTLVLTGTYLGICRINTHFKWN